MNKKVLTWAFVGIFLLLAGTFWGIKLYGAKKVEEDFNNFVKSTKLYEIYDIKVKSFDYDPLSREAIFKDVVVKNKELEGLPEEAYSEFFAKEVRFKYEELKDGFNLTLKAFDSKLKTKDEEIFYPKNITEVSLKDRRLKFKDYTDAKDYMELETEFYLDNFDRKIFSLLSKLYTELLEIATSKQRYTYYEFSDKIQEDVFLLISKLAMIVPEKIEIEYKEKGLVGKVIKKVALQSGKSYEEIKKELVKELSREIKREKDEKVKTLLMAFKHFAEGKKGKLEVEIENKEGTSLQEIIALFVAYRGNNKLVLEKLSQIFDVKVEFEAE